MFSYHPQVITCLPCAIMHVSGQEAKKLPWKAYIPVTENKSTINLHIMNMIIAGEMKKKKIGGSQVWKILERWGVKEASGLDSWGTEPQWEVDTATKTERWRVNKLHKPQAEETAKLLRKKSSRESKTNKGGRSKGGRIQRGSGRAAS